MIGQRNRRVHKLTHIVRSHKYKASSRHSRKSILSLDVAAVSLAAASGADTFERKRYVIRIRLEHAIWDSPLTGASNDQRRGIPRLQQGPRATVETTRRRKPSVTDERPME